MLVLMPSLWATSSDFLACQCLYSVARSSLKSSKLPCTSSMLWTARPTRSSEFLSTPGTPSRKCASSGLAAVPLVSPRATAGAGAPARAGAGASATPSEIRAPSATLGDFPPATTGANLATLGAATGATPSGASPGTACATPETAGATTGAALAMPRGASPGTAGATPAGACPGAAPAGACLVFSATASTEENDPATTATAAALTKGHMAGWLHDTTCPTLWGGLIWSPRSP
mmetsp:Transcript_49120/g.158097  ORF Transcript_49120/g.158097 Transcript_49120/m.158097 type:complete len:232 (-) Transcript_49120:31-726(-)